MADKNKKRDPMPPPDATPEEIGEFWDTHSLADYWDETHEVEFQVNLKSGQNPSPDEYEAAEHSDTLSAEEGWQKLKELVQSVKPADFEKLAAVLLKSVLNIPFVVARSGDQPSGDARSLTGEVSIQAKNYSDRTSLNAKEIEGDIRQVNRILQDLQVYVLVVSRDAAQLHDTLDAVSEDTGLDIVVLELTDELSDLGALCVTLWEDIRDFFDLSDTDQEFSDWIQIARDEPKTHQKIKDVQDKLKDGIQTQKHVQKDIEKYLLKHFSRGEGFNPINLSEAIDREFLESKIADWWETGEAPICCLEGKEGHGKTWIAAKWINSICEKENIVVFWLDSKHWKRTESISDLLRACFSRIYPTHEREKISKLQNKSAKIWRKTLIVLDGVNESGAIKAAQSVLDEYFSPNSQWTDRLGFLLTTRPLDDYPDFESYLWRNCHKISIAPFNDSELQDALTRQGLQLEDLPDSLMEIARIPRYLQTCIRLRNQFHSFDSVTKEMVLWADLLDKIDRTDPQIKQKFGWHRAKDAQEILADLAKQLEWTDIDAAPEASVRLLEKYFPNYREVRHDLEEQNISLEAGALLAKLNTDHVMLGWALYLSNLFGFTEFTGIRDFAESLQNALEPIPSEDRRTEALFVALQITAISSDPEISQDQLSQKRAALMLAWFHSHNAQITDERLSFWAEEDPDAYAQVVEFEFKHHNSPNYEEFLIKPIAKIWQNEKGQIDRLASRLTKWFFPSNVDSITEVVDSISSGEDPFPTMYYTRNRLLAAALSILSQRPERQFLETLARCYGSSESKVQYKEDIGRLMRWGYTEKVLDGLRLLAEQSESDALLLDGIYGLANSLRVNLPPVLERPLSEEDRELYARAEQSRHNSKFAFDRVSNQEQLLTGESPEANVKGNYHGLDYLAVRTDLPCLTQHDKVEIKKVLHHISANTKLGQGLSASLEGFCLENLLPWVAKYEPEGYAKLACNLKINALNQRFAYLTLLEVQGIIFQSKDHEEIAEVILGMKARLAQDEDFYLEVELLTSLVTEILLFSVPEEKLIDWFEFLASHKRLRVSICYEPLPYLLEQLLPKSIVRLAQQKLETLWSLPSGNQTGSNGESKEFSEEEFWCTLYAYGALVDENTVNYALEALKVREPNSTGTFPMFRLALSDSNQFLAEMLTDKEIRKHLFSRHGKRFIMPIYEGEKVLSYDTLMSLLPTEVAGSFLCLPDQNDDLTRWGRDLMARMFSILQGAEGDSNSIEEGRFEVNREVLRAWAEQNTTDFLQLADEYLELLSKSPWYCQVLSDLTDAIFCLLLRFQPTVAMLHYRQSNTKGFKIVCLTYYGVETFLDQLWRVEECRLSEHHDLRRKLLEECLNDEEIMFMTLAALVGEGEEELWSLVTEEYLASPYAKERNLGISILPWFGNDKAIEKLEQLKSDDPSQWVRGHAWWAYEVAQQERSCREVYREALRTHDLFRISAVFEQIKPALSPTARWWHGEIEKEEGFHEESQDIDPRLDALHYRFWYRWGNSSKTKSNIEVFGRKLREYCRGEKISAGSPPRIAPWWKPSSD